MMTTLTHTANARSQLFQLIALGFTHPVEAFHRVLQDGSYSHALVAAAAGAQCHCHFAHQEKRAFADFEADYIHLFQMGRGGKPIVPLSAGDHDDLAQGQGRPEFLLEYSGWYRHFGLKINTDENANEFPDHLACQLEFMSWLAHLETNCGDEPELQQGYQCAQRDFLQRHLQPFLELLVSELQQKASQPRSNPLYLSLAASTLQVTDIMLEQFEATLATASATDTRDDPESIAAVNLWG
jgi:DMSO reductase family type II enzyme chaperone